MRSRPKLTPIPHDFVPVTGGDAGHPVDGRPGSAADPVSAGAPDWRQRAGHGHGIGLCIDDEHSPAAVYALPHPLVLPPSPRPLLLAPPRPPHPAPLLLALPRPPHPAPLLLTPPRPAPSPSANAAMFKYYLYRLLYAAVVGSSDMRRTAANLSVRLCIADVPFPPHTTLAHNPSISFWGPTVTDLSRGDACSRLDSIRGSRTSRRACRSHRWWPASDRRRRPGRSRPCTTR